MKALLIVVFFLLLCAAAGAALESAKRRKRPPLLMLEKEHRDAMLLAIAQVESGNDQHAISARGERGRCQFTQATWERYTPADFSTWAASGAPLVTHVERAHYNVLVGDLIGRGFEPTPELIAAAWRLPNVSNLQLEMESRTGRATRIGNLYRDFFASDSVLLGREES